MPNTNGKAGTITVAEFEALEAMVENYGAKLLAAKVAKLCISKSTKLLHEYNASVIGKAYGDTAAAIQTAVGMQTANVSRDCYNTLKSVVDTYGPEVVVTKLGKLAKRMETEGAELRTLFPRVRT
jgi:hypothetical protein